MKTINALALALATIVALAAAPTARAQSTKNVTFARGATSATVTNVISGYNSINYRVNAKQGTSDVSRRGKVAPFRMRITIPPAVVNNPPVPDDGGHGPDQWRVTGIDGQLNVRSGPGTSYPRVGSVSKGSIVENNGCAGSWCRIKTLQGTGPIISGWISEPYFREYTAR